MPAAMAARWRPVLMVTGTTTRTSQTSTIPPLMRRALGRARSSSRRWASRASSTAAGASAGSATASPARTASDTRRRTSGCSGPPLRGSPGLSGRSGAGPLPVGPSFIPCWGRLPRRW